MTVRAVGFKEFARELSEISDNLSEQLYPVIEDGAREVQQDAKSRVPVDTGDLRDSLVVKGNKKRLLARVEADYPKSGRTIKKGSKKSVPGAKVYYAYAVEYGTKYQKEQPFLIPAFQAAEESIVQRVKKRLEEIVDGTP